MKGTRCSGSNMDGTRCRNRRIDGPGAYFCPAHKAQAGLRGPRSQKAVQSAVRPSWIAHEPEPNDWDGFEPQEF